MEHANRQPDLVLLGQWHEWEPPLWTPSFICEWLASLENPLANDSGSFWEEASAVRELKELHYTSRVTGLASTETRRMLRLVIREIDIYRHLYDTSLSTNRDFRRFRDFLTLLSRKLDKFAAETKTKAILDVRNELSADIRHMIEQLPQAEMEFWNDVLDLTESDLQHPIWKVEALEKGEVKPNYMIPDWVGQLDYEAFCWKVPKVLSRRANLDTRLQVRLAVVFHLYLPRLSWRTIARLITLAYMCGELVNVRDGNILVPGNKTPLTVDKIEKKLRNARPDPSCDRDAYFSDDVDTGKSRS